MTEAILFLKENSNLWGIEQVREAIWQVKVNEKRERTDKKMAGHKAEDDQITVESVAMGMEDLVVDCVPSK